MSAADTYTLKCKGCGRPTEIPASYDRRHPTDRKEYLSVDCECGFRTVHYTPNVADLENSHETD